MRLEAFGLADAPVAGHEDFSCGHQLHISGFEEDGDLNGLWNLAMTSDGTVQTNADYPYYKHRGSDMYLWWMWHGDVGHWVVNPTPGVHGEDRMTSAFGDFECPQAKTEWEGAASGQSFSIVQLGVLTNEALLALGDGPFGKTWEEVILDNYWVFTGHACDKYSEHTNQIIQEMGLDAMSLCDYKQNWLNNQGADMLVPMQILQDQLSPDISMEAFWTMIMSADMYVIFG